MNDRNTRQPLMAEPIEMNELHSQKPINQSSQPKDESEFNVSDEDDLELADEFEILDTEGQEQAEPRWWHIIKSRGVQMYLAAMLCGSLMKMLSKILMETMDPFFLVLTRMSVTSAIALGYMWWKSIPHYFWGPPGVRILLAIRGVLGFVNITLTYYALQYMTLPDKASISFLTPLATCVAARIFLKESYVYQQFLASLISLLGVVLIARPTFLFGSAAESDSLATPEQRAGAIIACLVSVVGATVVMILLRHIGDRVHALASVSSYAVASVVGSAIALLVAKPSDGFVLPTNVGTWIVLLSMGTFGFGLQYLSSKAIQLEEATVLANLKYTQILYAVTFEFLIWHDLPTIWSILGTVLILGGVLWSAKYKVKKPKKTSN